ncbi:MAG: type II toxin-antitoxin system prevent-host-death family antitoxin [Thermodesulfobacteriota bacterium]|nr:type II toxin-antitoxin system prevent-host-death family antitoxin [Thermodesulfobacteriota bacterium]
MQNVDLNQAQQDLPQLIEKSVAGGEIIITKGGLPVAKLIPIGKPAKARQSDTAKGLIKISSDFDKPLEDFQAYL